MTRAAYFECFAGASGDMILGALVDAGWHESDLRAALNSVPIGGWELEVTTTKKGALRAARVHIRVTEPQPERDVRDIRPLIEQSGLPDVVKDRAIALFQELAVVEGREHDQPPETVHFHEVGAVDSILDIIGACAGLHALGIERVYVSPINVGGGVVPTRDGVLPVPGPAALELLRRKGAPIYASEYGPEFLTPTGALVLATLAHGFGPFPAMRVEHVGYGAGQKDFVIPNVLRISIGELDAGWHGPRRPMGGFASLGSSPLDPAPRHSHDHGGQERGHPHEHDAAGHDHPDHVPGSSSEGGWEVEGTGGGVDHSIATSGIEDSVIQLETNLDNMNPEWYGHLADRLFAQGALDVTMAPLLMKKGRPGTLLSVLIRPEDVEVALDTLFSESTTLGVRMAELTRRTLPRKSEVVETPFGDVRVKLAFHRGSVRSVAPEYDDCRTAAVSHGVPLRRVYAAAVAAAANSLRA
jgi:pyridinium-3,5-bisthiocarboxylic acid mononucleotide nickel chelatase